MTTPLISIDRQQSHLYECFITAGTQLHHSIFCQPDLAACLQNAASNVPAGNGMVEIIYRHIHMGTHMLEEIVNDAERLAKHIADRYARLMNMRVVVL